MQAVLQKERIVKPSRTAGDALSQYMSPSWIRGVSVLTFIKSCRKTYLEGRKASDMNKNCLSIKSKIEVLYTFIDHLKIQSVIW